MTNKPTDIPTVMDFLIGQLKKSEDKIHFQGQFDQLKHALRRQSQPRKGVKYEDHAIPRLENILKKEGDDPDMGIITELYIRGYRDYESLDSFIEDQNKELDND